jgi:hypothetical protein
MADLVILTKRTSEIAMGKEYGSRSTPSYQRRFFTEMGPYRRNHQLFWCLTKTRLTLETVYPTVSGTQDTTLQEGLQLLGLLPYERGIT